MRHGMSGNRLGRKPAHRRAMVRNLATSLVDNGRITTTVARAKELRMFIEPLVTLGKKGDLAALRTAMAKLPNKSVVHKIFQEIAPRFKERPGGYTRIVKTGFRQGDNASMAIIEFVD